MPKKSKKKPAESAVSPPVSDEKPVEKEKIMVPKLIHEIITHSQDISLTPEHTLLDAVRLFLSFSRKHIPIIESGSKILSGIVSESDIRSAMESPLSSEPEVASEALQKHKISDILSTEKPQTFAPTTPIVKIAETLDKSNLTCVAIIDPESKEFISLIEHSDLTKLVIDIYKIIDTVLPEELLYIDPVASTSKSSKQNKKKKRSK